MKIPTAVLNRAPTLLRRVLNCTGSVAVLTEKSGSTEALKELNRLDCVAARRNLTLNGKFGIGMRGGDAKGLALAQ